MEKRKAAPPDQAASAACAALEAVLRKSSLIAIVDDETSFRNSMRRLLVSHGFSVAVFSSATQFLADEFLPTTACLVADIHMPVMSGIELYRHLLASGRPIPTIFITAYPEEAVRREMFSLGASCYLPKPLDEGALLACLRGALSLGDEP